MFVGHYSAAFVAKRMAPRVPLWVYFVAVQFVDFLWAPFVLVGIEKARIVPGITASNPLDLYFMPYTHSLVATVIWSGLAFAAARLMRAGGGSVQAAGVVAFAIASHWFLDLLVHRPDLPLYDDTMKMGFGLWNYRLPAFFLEIVCLLGGIALYMRGESGRLINRSTPVLIFTVALILVQVSSTFGPIPSSLTFMAVGAFMSYALLSLGAAWAERASG